MDEKVRRQPVIDKEFHKSQVYPQRFGPFASAGERVVFGIVFKR